MIKLMQVEYRCDYTIYCEFSDGMAGMHDLQGLLTSSDTPLTVPLRDFVNFRKFFLRSGALCWSNGLELDPQALYWELEKAGMLISIQKAA